MLWKRESAKGVSQPHNTVHTCIFIFHHFFREATCRILSRLSYYYSVRRDWRYHPYKRSRKYSSRQCRGTSVPQHLNYRHIPASAENHLTDSSINMRRLARVSRLCASRVCVRLASVCVSRLCASVCVSRLSRVLCVCLASVSRLVRLCLASCASRVLCVSRLSRVCLASRVCLSLLVNACGVWLILCRSSFKEFKRFLLSSYYRCTYRLCRLYEQTFNILI